MDVGVSVVGEGVVIGDEVGVTGEGPGVDEIGGDLVSSVDVGVGDSVEGGELVMIDESVGIGECVGVGSPVDTDSVGVGSSVEVPSVGVGSSVEVSSVAVEDSVVIGSSVDVGVGSSEDV